MRQDLYEAIILLGGYEIDRNKEMAPNMLAIISDAGVQYCPADCLREAPVDQCLYMTADAKSGALLYRQMGKPVWVYFEAERLRQAILPALPMAQQIVILTHPSTDDFADVHFHAQKWAQDGRWIQVSCPPDGKSYFEDMNGQAYFDALNKVA
jgi:hypothetical protein